MIEIRTTAVFSKWFNSLKDRRAKARIQARIVILLSGGDKSSQQADIAKAKEISKQSEV